MNRFSPPCAKAPTHEFPLLVSGKRLLGATTLALSFGLACSDGGPSDAVANTGGSSPSGGSAGTGGAGPGSSGGAGGGTGGAGTGTGGGAGGAGSGTGGGATGGASATGGVGATGGAVGSGGAGNPVCDASSPPAITRLGLETVVQADDLNAFIYAAQPPGSSDWYLVDILGFIWVYSNGAVRETPFLDVSAEVQGLNFSYDERGLLSIAFSPDYEASGKFYVALIPTSTATADHDLVLEYSRSAADPFVADVSTRKALLDLEPRGEDATSGQMIDLNKYHNASTIKFGPDGMLYVGMGDGGGQCNSALPGAPQDISSPFGKMLRLDPSQPEPYAALGNPFAEEGDARVLHYGIRNPFRFSFDSLTGDLYFGDVGQWSFEELSFAPAGAEAVNFGWPAFEALTPNPQSNCSTNVSLREGSTHTPPIYAIPHGTDSGAGNLVVAIVGGSVYRGTAIPELYGTYLFGEYYAGRPMKALYQCGEETSEVLSIRRSCDANFPNDPCFVPQGGSAELGEVGAIVEGNDGELYLAANNNTLMKVVPVP